MLGAVGVSEVPLPVGARVGMCSHKLFPLVFAPFQDDPELLRGHGEHV